MYEFNYNNGKREGKQRYFHDNGKVKIEGSWASGKEEGTIKVFDNKGVLLSEKVFENGVINKNVITLSISFSLRTKFIPKELEMAF